MSVTEMTDAQLDAKLAIPCPEKRRKPRKRHLEAVESTTDLVAEYRRFRDARRGPGQKRPTVSSKMASGDKRGITWARGRGRQLYQQLIEAWLAGRLPAFTVPDAAKIMFYGDPTIIDADYALTLVKETR